MSVPRVYAVYPHPASRIPHPASRIPHPSSRFPLPASRLSGIDMHQRQSVNMRGPRGTVPCEIGGAAAENRLPNGEP